MINFRIVAAAVALQIFVSTVLWQDAGPLVGLAIGAVAAVATYLVGSTILARIEESGAPAPTAPDPRRLLLLGSAAAFVALAAFQFILRGDGGSVRWLAVAVLVAALVGVGFASLRLNRFARSVPEPGEET